MELLIWMAFGLTFILIIKKLRRKSRSASNPNSEPSLASNKKRQPKLRIARGWPGDQEFFSIVKARDDWVVLDTETTGLSESSEVLEIAIIDAHGKVLLDERVMPKGRIPSEATEIHGIKRSMLKGSPTWDKIHDRVREILSDKMLVIYNAEFDLRLMSQSAAIYDLPPPATQGVCMMLAYAEHRGIPHPYRKGEYRWHKLVLACRHEGVDVLGAHSAAGDAEMTRQLILHVAKGY